MTDVTTPPGRPYAVVDIDGVLADVRHRLHHIERSPKDWSAFFAAAPQDPVLVEGVSVVDRLSAGHEIVYVTGRPAHLRPGTIAWLRRHNLPEADVVMRRNGDRRPARLVKLDLLRRLARQRPVAVLVDDDPEVCAAARRAGFAVFVADWMGRPVTLEEAQGRDGQT